MSFRWQIIFLDKDERKSMTNEGIAQKLALLPEGLAEENFQTWQRVLEGNRELSSFPSYSQVLIPMIGWISEFIKSEQTKLFRAGLPGLTLMISTKEKHGLEKNDPYVFIDIDDADSMIVGYCNSYQELESQSCKNSEIISAVQPLLNRLWNETRGKKNA